MRLDVGFDLPSKLRQHPVRASDRQSSVADGECDPLGRVASHVARGENARARGLDRTWLAVRQGPVAGARGVGPSHYEALGVDGDARRQPAGTRLCSDENEERRAVDFARTALWEFA